MRLNRNLLGILSLIFGVMLFSTQDAIIKSISGDYAVTFAMATRCLVALPLLLLMVHFECGIAKLRSALFWALVMRGAILLVAYTTYYMALPALPLAEAIALFFAAPIIVTLLSVPMLGENVSAQSWAAIALGFHRCTDHPATRHRPLQSRRPVQPRECRDLRFGHDHCPQTRRLGTGNCHGILSECRLSHWRTDYRGVLCSHWSRTRGPSQF